MAATRLQPVDVVLVGVGLTGTILGKELADAGLTVIGLERGRFRDTSPDFAMPHAHDELKYVRRHELMQDLSRETITFRNAMNETALPMRKLGSFLPGEGVGGAAVAKEQGIGFMTEEKMRRTRDALLINQKPERDIPLRDLYTNEFLPKLFPRRPVP
jgi:choline dehydrogenase-like flavoprotein